MSVSQANIDALLNDAAEDSQVLGGEFASTMASDNIASVPPVQSAPDVRRILNLPVSLTVRLAERDMPVKSILAMTVGTIIEFDVSFDSEPTLHVADRTIGYGQAVKVGESFGLRLSHVGSVVERIDSLGGTQASP